MGNSKKTLHRKVWLLILEFLILLLLTAMLFVVTKLSKLEKNNLNPENISINEGLSEETQKIFSDNQTIALFGLDNRSNGDLNRGRSDVIMLANINSKTNEIRLVSVYRDSFLDTGNQTFEKCNAAYAKGGPERAISMLNRNLDLAITDYVTVDFNAIVECVDLLGGIELTITQEEANLMLGYVEEINKLTGKNSKCPTSGGTYTCDGVLACAFARIRYGGGDDYRRTERQRTVLSAMMQKAKKVNLRTLNSLINEAFDDIATSFSNTELISLATKIFRYNMGESGGFPIKKSTKRYQKTGDVVVPCDLVSNVVQLHDFLFGTKDYLPSPTVRLISEQITEKTGLTENDGFE